MGLQIGNASRQVRLTDGDKVLGSLYIIHFSHNILTNIFFSLYINNLGCYTVNQTVITKPYSITQPRNNLFSRPTQKIMRWLDFNVTLWYNIHVAPNCYGVILPESITLTMLGHIRKVSYVR